jgi:lactoylglutathione lyase
MEFKLLVLRTQDLTRLADFYTLLGFTFEYHRHGSSPLHYSTTIGQTVLEIYPLAKNQLEVDKELRLGFGIENFDATVEKLKNKEVLFSTEPTQTTFGFMAVIVDPDGRKIELYRR